MSTEDIILDIVKCGIYTVVSSRVVRSMGEKDISDIIQGAGWAVMGTNMIYFIKPTVQFMTSMANGFKWFRERIDALPGLSMNEMLNAILKLGGKP